MTGEEAARRYGHRPGFQLVSYRDVAIPVFKARLRCLFVEEKSVPPVQEFVLRAIDQGLNRVHDVAGLLGVLDRVVQNTVVELLSSDDVQLVGRQTPDGGSTLHLTRKGEQAVREARKIVAQEYVLPVVLDGLTREITIEPRSAYIKPAAVRDYGLLELAPIPRRRPTLDDFPYDRVAQALRQRRSTGGNLLAVLAVDWRERFFRTDAVVLVYKAEEGDGVAVGFVVGSRESHEHEAAFASQSNSDFALLTRTLAAPDAMSALPSGMVQAADAAAESQDLVTARDSAQLLVESLDAQLEEADPATATDDLRKQRDEARAQVLELEAQLNAYTVRWLEVHEHAPLLRRALAECGERLMIVSPWIRADVVDSAFLADLERAAQRGVEIFIGYGLGGEEREKDRDKRAREELMRLGSDHERMHVVRFGDTHAKALVCDRTFAVTTSFNWLSFRGDPHRSFRDERGAYVSESRLVDEQFAFYLPRFQQPARPPRGSALVI